MKKLKSMSCLYRVLILGFAATAVLGTDLTTPALASATSTSQTSTCTISDLSSLANCVANRGSYQAFQMTANVSCSGQSCCGSGSGGGALINFDGLSGISLSGNGFTLTRHLSASLPAKACPAISASSSSQISISNINIDDDSTIQACAVNDGCTGSIYLNGANGINISGVSIYSAKASAIYAWSSNNVSIDQSTISNAGIIGIYVGDGTYSSVTASNNIAITNSTISYSQTNGIAFQGVYGTNRIEKNIIQGNHHHGLWLQPNGLPYDGGQIYIPNASGIAIDNNVIADGYCDNCQNPMVMGLELAGEGALNSLNIYENYMYNSYGSALFLDANGQISSNTLVWSNVIRGFTDFLLNDSGGNTLSGATIGNNSVGDSVPSLNLHGAWAHTIYRLSYSGLHEEADTSTERPGATLEGTFVLANYPRPGANPSPIFRCFVNSSTTNDFPSFDRSCEGQGSQNLHSILGYSFEPSLPGVQPFYRCAVIGGSDHFVSWDSHCEGQNVEGLLGYAVPG